MPNANDERQYNSCVLIHGRTRARAREFVNYALMRARAHVSTRAAGVNATRYARVPFGVCD